MTHNFKVGGKVVCVANNWPNPQYKKIEIGTVLKVVGFKDGIRVKSGLVFEERVGEIYHPKYFIPIRDEEFQQVTYTKIISQVPCGAQ